MEYQSFFFPELDWVDYFILIIGSPIVIFSYFNSFFFLGINEFKKFNFFELTKSLSFTLLTCTTYFFSATYQTYVLLFIFSNIVHIFLSFTFFLKKNYINLRKLHLINNAKKYVSVFTDTFSYSMISYLACTFACLLSRYTLFFIDRFIMIDDSGKTMLGYYSVGLANIDVISILPATLAFFIFPKISAADSMAKKIKITNQMIIVCILFFILISVLSFTVAPYFFDLLYGSVYRHAVPMFQAQLPTVLLISIISCISSFIGGIGNQKTMIYAPLTALFFMSILSFVCLQFEFSIYNFIYAQNFSYFLYLVIYLCFFIKKWKEV